MKGVIEYVRDITERKRMEEKLKQSEEKYSLLVEDIHDGVFVIQDEKISLLTGIAGYLDIVLKRLLDLMCITLMTGKILKWSRIVITGGRKGKRYPKNTNSMPCAKRGKDCSQYG